MNRVFTPNKIAFALVIVILGSIGFTSCESTTKESKVEKSPKTVIEDSIGVYKKRFDDYSEVIQSVILNPKSVFRNTHFEMNDENIRAIEVASHVETGENYIVYNLDSLFPYNHDLEYTFDSTSHVLNKIDFSIYCKTERERDSLYTMFKTYYAEQIGLPKDEKGNVEWDQRDDAIITLNKMGTSKRPDILLTLVPKTTED